MSTLAERKAAKRARRPIYATLRRVVDLETGEERLGWLASHPVDRAIAKERKYRVGDDYRLEIKRPRNVKFHRLVHAIGQLLVDNVDGFESLSAHDAIKRVQRESGVCCEEMEIDLGALGKVLGKQAESLAFDEMTVERFTEFFDGITHHIDAIYLPDLESTLQSEYLSLIHGVGP